MFQGQDLILEDELYDLLFTNKDTEAIKSPYIHVKYRRDPITNKVIICPACAKDGKIEGIADCPYCKGKGKLHDQVIFEGFTYRFNYLRERYNLSFPSKVGRDDNSPTTLITDSRVYLEKEDKVIVPRLNNLGKIQIPLSVEHEHTIYFSSTMKASASRKSDFNIAILWD